MPSLAEGDALIVRSLDRYTRSLADLIRMASDVHKRKIGFTSLPENLDIITPGGRAVFRALTALAEFNRGLIIAATHEGLATARARGGIGGEELRAGRPRSAIRITAGKMIV